MMYYNRDNLKLFLRKKNLAALILREARERERADPLASTELCRSLDDQAFVWISLAT